jgi:carbohydrate kinase (thermoresistant glucokinase family)
MSMAASPQSPEPFTGAVVVMGVASCGKTTIGEALARRLGARFVEGDSLHAESSVAKMTRGEALTDDDRWPWLARVGESLRGGGAAIASCSALKRSYRDAIARAAERPVSFIHLHGARALLTERIAARKGHFMPPSLLDSQLATLEKPESAERAITLDIAAPPDDIVAAAEAFLRKRPNHAA